MYSPKAVNPSSKPTSTERTYTPNGPNVKTHRTLTFIGSYPETGMGNIAKKIPGSPVPFSKKNGFAYQGHPTQPKARNK